MALGEDDRPLRVDARREKHRRAGKRRFMERLGLEGSRDGVEVDDAEHGIALLLGCAVLPVAPE